MVLNSVEMTKYDVNNQLKANVLPNLNELLVRISNVNNKKSRNDLFGEVVKNVVLPKKEGWFGGDYKLKLATTDNNKISIGADDEPSDNSTEAEPNTDPNGGPNGGPNAEPNADPGAKVGGGRKRRRKKTRGRRLKKGGRKSKRR